MHIYLAPISLRHGRGDPNLKLQD